MPLHGPLPNSCVFVDFFRDFVCGGTSHRKSHDNEAEVLHHALFTCGRIAHPLYFLSHFHRDHTSGLHEKWCRGPIFCSEITRKLLLTRFPHLDSVALSLELGKTYRFFMGEDNKSGFFVENVFVRSSSLSAASSSTSSTALDRIHSAAPDKSNIGVPLDVTLHDAYHCPGSVIIVLKSPAFGTYVHLADCCCTGDYSNKILGSVQGTLRSLDPQTGGLHPGNLNNRNPHPIDNLFIDNTFLHPIFDFPDANTTLSKIVKLVEQKVAECHDTSLVVLVGLDSIGKEELLIRLSLHFNIPIELQEERYNAVEATDIYQMCHFRRGYSKCLSVLESSSSRTSTDMCEDSQTLIIACVSRRKLATSIRLVQADSRRGECVVGILPSGWCVTEISSKDCSSGPLFSFPYSSHSGFFDLCRVALCLRPQVVTLTCPLPCLNSNDDVASDSMSRDEPQRFSASNGTEKPMTAELFAQPYFSSQLRCVSVSPKVAPSNTSRFVYDGDSGLRSFMEFCGIESVILGAGRSRPRDVSNKVEARFSEWRCKRRLRSVDRFISESDVVADDISSQCIVPVESQAYGAKVDSTVVKPIVINKRSIRNTLRFAGCDPPS